MRIGITTRVDTPAGYFENRDALAQSWGELIAIAFPREQWMALPNLGSSLIADYCTSWGIDRIILSGGADIGENIVRDETELALLNWAQQFTLPVLGVCRGMQMLAHREGCKLVRVDNHIATRHKIDGVYEGEVNSFHKLKLSRCPNNYKVLAESKDGCIEAIRHVSLPWEGWMWHPEREIPIDQYGVGLLRKIFL